MASTVHVSLIGCVALRSTPLCVCVSIFTMKVLCVLSSWPGSLRSAGLWAEPGRRAMLPFSFTLTRARVSSEDRRWLPARPKHHACIVLHPDRSPRVLRREDADFRPGASIMIPFSFTLTGTHESSEDRRWLPAGPKPVLPFSFTLTGARASSEERPLLAGPKHRAPLLLHPDPSVCVLRREEVDFRLGPSSPRRLNQLLCREHGSPRLGRLRSFGLPWALSGPPASFSVSFGRCPSGTRQGAGTWCQLQPGQRAPRSSRLWGLLSVPCFLPS